MSVSSTLIPAADADPSGRTIQHSAESGAQRTRVDRKVFFLSGGLQVHSLLMLEVAEKQYLKKSNKTSTPFLWSVNTMGEVNDQRFNAW